MDAGRADGHRSDGGEGCEQGEPMFVGEPVPAQDHDVMAEVARATHLPIATRERVFDLAFAGNDMQTVPRKGSMACEAVKARENEQGDWG